MEQDRATWLRLLRATRSAPPARAAADEHRRAIYGASLQQFEELLAAASEAGPASQPLPLFYALSQGGRAIVAAHGDEPDVFGHGLRERRVEHPPTDLLHRKIERASTRAETDLFGAVARASGSADIVGTVELGAVWAATPGCYRLPEVSWREDWRLALNVDDGYPASTSGEGVNVMVSSLSGNPYVEGLAVFAGRRYPTLPAATKAGIRAGSENLGPGNWIGDLAVPIDGDDREATLDAVAPKYAMTTKRALIPALPAQDQVLTPLMLWCLMLFGLSILARYHPGTWVDALAVDHSAVAVPLEAILDQAVDALPALVYEAIVR